MNKYKKLLNLHQDTKFILIDHADATVATVYKVIDPAGLQYIFKLFDREKNYLREIYFLKYFVDILPVPDVINIIPPTTNFSGAILMEYLSGDFLKPETMTNDLAYKIGGVLAEIHSYSTDGFGDLIQIDRLDQDPRVHFTDKFEEGVAECIDHLPAALIKKCCDYYYKNLDLLDSIDGPCIIHRDFRPANIFVKCLIMVQ